MSNLWPHTPYAEDQPFPHLILTTHVLYRGFQAGSTVGIGAGVARYVFRSSSSSSKSAAALIVRSAGVGGVVGLGLMGVMLPAKMAGKELIEWQDRSWRLLENKGQMEVDNWSAAGMVLGAVAKNSVVKSSGWKSVVGGAGVGSMVGVMGYMGWRYGVKGGKLDKD